MWAKIKTPKNPQVLKQNPNKYLDQTLIPKKYHAKFPSHKKFQKGLNYIKRKIGT